MKQGILLFFILMFRETANAQDWPVGTTWVYDQVDYGPPDYSNYAIVKIIKDTLIQNQSAKILQTFSWNSNWDSTHAPAYPDYYVIKADSGRVMIWDPDSSKFYLIYDFNAQPGDTVTYYTLPMNYNFNEPDFVRYKIDSIQLISTSGPFKKKFFYHKIDGSLCYFYYKGIIEDIGGLFYFFQTYCAVDPPAGGDLLCFTNGQFQYPPGGLCKIPTATKNLFQQDLEVIPNPTQEYFKVNGIALDDYEISIYNETGQHMKFNRTPDQFDIRHFPEGLYFIQFKSKKNSFTLKICKR